jgi:hypothetical protein
LRIESARIFKPAVFHHVRAAVHTTSPLMKSTKRL